MLPVIVILLHFTACVFLIRKAMRWTRHHPLGADASEALLDRALFAAVTSSFLLLLSLFVLAKPTWMAMTRASYEEAAFYGLCLTITLAASTPLIGFSRRCREKAKLMTLSAGLSLFFTCGGTFLGVFIILGIRE